MLCGFTILLSNEYYSFNNPNYVSPKSLVGHCYTNLFGL